VVPNTGLGIAAYNETIGVTGGNGITGSLAVSFEVTPAPVYGISLDHSGTHTFPAAIVGYPAQASETVTVSNLGDDVKGTGPLTIANSNPNGFRLSRNSLAIANGGAAVFTVVPNGNLGAGTHKSDITVGDTHGNSETFEVSFTVNPVVYTVAFNAPGNSPATWVEQVIRNSTVTLPMEPTRIGYTFGGWYTTPETGGSKFDATAGVTRDWTLYARWLSSNASLAALSVSSGDLIHLYDTTYSVEVPNAVASIEVRATKADGNAVLAQYPSNNPVSLNVGSNIITVRVAAPDKTTATDYTIIVVRQQPQSNNANLSSLGVSVGALSPAFSADRTAYTVSVPSTTGAITVAAVKADARSELTQSPGTLGSPVALAESTTKITLAVKAENGAAKTYTITVNKAESDDNNAVNVAIGIGDANIDLTRDTANDLSQEAGDVLNLTAPSGGIYHWWVDNVDNGAAEGITLNAGGYGYGTHSVLLQFVKDGATYGCEVQFRVVR
jgi:uncharacterized repeat protein (TIGR02543 family)